MCRTTQETFFLTLTVYVQLQNTAWLSLRKQVRLVYSLVYWCTAELHLLPPLKHTSMKVGMRVLMQRSQRTIHFVFTSTLCKTSVHRASVSVEWGRYEHVLIHCSLDWQLFAWKKKPQGEHVGVWRMFFTCRFWLGFNWETNSRKAYFPVFLCLWTCLVQTDL